MSFARRNIKALFLWLIVIGAAADCAGSFDSLAAARLRHPAQYDRIVGDYQVLAIGQLNKQPRVPAGTLRFSFRTDGTVSWIGEGRWTFDDSGRPVIIAAENIIWSTKAESYVFRFAMLNMDELTEQQKQAMLGLDKYPADRVMLLAFKKGFFTDYLAGSSDDETQAYILLKKGGQ